MLMILCSEIDPYFTFRSSMFHFYQFYLRLFHRWKQRLFSI